MLNYKISYEISRIFTDLTLFGNKPSIFGSTKRTNHIKVTLHKNIFHHAQFTSLLHTFIFI